jgi:hypothetical protein
MKLEFANGPGTNVHFTPQGKRMTEDVTKKSIDNDLREMTK